MIEVAARACVDVWLPVLADRLWVRQFSFTVLYEGDHLEGVAGRCVVDHDYGSMEITLFLNNIDDQDQLFHVLLHEVSHTVVAEFWHVEHSIIPVAVERSGRVVGQLVGNSFRYAHERFVQRMMSIVLQQHPYPDSWDKIPE